MQPIRGSKNASEPGADEAYHRLDRKQRKTDRPNLSDGHEWAVSPRPSPERWAYEVDHGCRPASMITAIAYYGRLHFIQ